MWAMIARHARNVADALPRYASIPCSAILPYRLHNLHRYAFLTCRFTYRYAYLRGFLFTLRNIQPYGFDRNIIRCGECQWCYAPHRVSCPNNNSISRQWTLDTPNAWQRKSALSLFASCKRRDGHRINRRVWLPCAMESVKHIPSSFTPFKENISEPNCSGTFAKECMHLYLRHWLLGNINTRARSPI